MPSRHRREGFHFSWLLSCRPFWVVLLIGFSCCLCCLLSLSSRRVASISGFTLHFWFPPYLVIFIFCARIEGLGFEWMRRMDIIFASIGLGLWLPLLFFVPPRRSRGRGLLLNFPHEKRRLTRQHHHRAHRKKTLSLLFSIVQSYPRMLPEEENKGKRGWMNRAFSK